MNWLFLVFAVLAAVVGLYWYLLWRVAARWNRLLTRSGRVPDNEILRKTFKLLGFLFSDEHKTFHDAELTAAVMRARIAFFAAMIAVLSWFVVVAIAPGIGG